MEYEPRTAIKGQVLADFIAEFTGTGAVDSSNGMLASTGGQEIVMEKVNPPDSIQLSEQIVQETEPIPNTEKVSPDTWILLVDRSSAASGSGVGIVVRTPEGGVIEQAVRLGFKASNNEAEYEALIIGMQKAKLLGVQDLMIHCDS